MKSKSDNLKLIGAYLSGQLTPAEKMDFERWINNTAENEMLFKEAQKIWINSGLRLTLADTVDETDADWQALKYRLANVQKRSKVVLLFLNPVILKVAAGIILLVGLTFLFTSRPRYETQNAVLKTDKDMMSFYLPDSTQVWLNANSTLIYDNHYNETARLVTLDGGAYFKVTHNEQIPFMVNTTDTYTKVLGTSFSLLEDSLATTLIVVQGKVSFAPYSNLKNEVTVSAKEKAVCSKGGVLMKYSKNKNVSKNSNQKDTPVFENEILHPVTYLKNVYAWRKNAINQSVIEGSIKSSATVVAYQDILLKIIYKKASGKLKTLYVTLPGVISPAGSLHYRKKLPDVLASTRSVTVKIESVDVKPIL